MKLQKCLALLLAGLLCVGAPSSFGLCSSVRAEEADGEEPIASTAEEEAAAPAYAAYIAQYADAARPRLSIPGVPAGTGGEYAGFSGSMMDETSRAAFSVTVPETGLYALQVSYVACEGNNMELEYALQVDGAAPFAESSDLTLYKRYVDDGEATVNAAGDEIRPEQKEQIAEQSVLIGDPTGYIQGALLFYFTAGEHRLTLESLRGDALVTGLELRQPEEAPSYTEYLEAYASASVTSGQYIKIDAEKPSVKSSPMLYAACDKTSYNMDPYPAGRERLNMLGGSNFGSVGQWVEYDFTVKESGFYSFNIKYKQNVSIGTSSFRDIYLDGEILNESWSGVSFPYSSKWQNKTLTDPQGEVLKVYLEAGEHTLRLAVSLGDYAGVLTRIEDVVAAMNSAYLESIMYLTTSPDIYRDYEVEKNLPHVLEVFAEQREQLHTLAELIREVAGGSNDTIALVDRMVYQLDDILDDPETYPERLDAVKSNITSLAAMIESLRAQPLALDYLEFYSPDVPLKKAEANVFQNIYNEFVNFLHTFFKDYSNVADDAEYEREVTVWLPTGRDQYRVLSSLIDNDFTPQEGIAVNLRLVSTANLLPATVAGIGPDVILQVANGDPLNYAIRGAVHDLSQFEDCEEVLARFSEAAVTPLCFDGAVYGLPETEVFYTMFYRTDILEDLGLEVPQTWDDFIVAATELQKNNLTVGLPNTLEVFAMFLFQTGGQFYADDTYECVINNAAGVDAFTRYTNLFTNYSLPLTYDALTRFRMGEMPIVIAEYTFFNNLQVGAPEISNLWEFTTVPGTPREDGSIDHSVAVTGIACMLMEGARDKDSSWEFLKWWTSSETQIAYGRNMEMVLGTAGRVATANVEASEALSWSRSNAQALSEARRFSRGLENVPGSYFLSRHLQNAFRKVVISNGDAKDSLRQYTKTINSEIASKCEELGVPLKRNTR